MGESSKPSVHLPAQDWAQLMHPAAQPAQRESDKSDFVPKTAEGSLAAVAASLRKSVTGMSKWGMADLTLGLYKLAGRHALEGTADTINGCSVTSLKELQEIYHWLDWALAAYTKDLQTLANHLKVKEEKIIKHVPTSEVLKPAFYIAVDDTRQCVVMSIRGTLTATDILTDLNPHSEQFVGGYAHSGMLAAARSFMDSEASTLQDILIANEGYKLVLVGHSLGAGTASLLCMLLHGSVNGGPVLTLGIPSSEIVCWGYGCPPCVDKGLAERAIFINNVILQDDIVARACPAALEDLRAEILATNWSQVFQNGSRMKTMIELVKSTHATLKQVEPALGLESGYLFGQAKKYGYAALVAATNGVACSLQKAQQGEHGVNAQKAANWLTYGAAATESVLSIASRGVSGLTSLSIGSPSTESVSTVETEEATREVLEMSRLVVPGMLFHIIRRPLKPEEEIIPAVVSMQMDLEVPPVNTANACSLASKSEITPMDSQENSPVLENAIETFKSSEDGKGESSKTKLEVRHRCTVVRGDEPSSRFKRIVLSSSLLSDHSLLNYRECLSNSIHWAASDVPDI
ncbi:hypothetical protein O6H91_18G069400 [Diphasiastrum complanatum]|uniref:Uncharacterized protein n=1 Tax=Diphasiastrum complanatum TaxID=34168 RepID=A0ACC2B2I8_DIPCM|nr:hypothetical protein O6H91_18G069400 [Diphasiastrum complanatum]